MNDAKRPLIITSLSIASVLLMIAVYFVPIWWIALTAPNYPETAFPDAVRINFHMNGVFNGCALVVKDEIHEEEALDCVHEMDTINHYVGMYPIAAGGPIERGFSPFLITLLIVMVIGFAISDPKKRMMFLGVAFALNTIWMGLTIYTKDGLNYQNEGYLYALMNQLNQDVNDKTIGSIKTADSQRALKQLRDSLAGREVEDFDEEDAAEEAAAAEKEPEMAEKERLIIQLKDTYDNDLSKGRVTDEWAGNGFQLMAWHYGKVLGRYFNNQDEIRPMVNALTIATHVVFVGLIAAMLLLLIAGTRATKNIVYWLMVLVPMALPVFFIIDYAAWLWWYGHTLNDMGAFAVKPFMPTVFGEGKVAQFATFSYPSIGFGLMMLNSIILAAIALMRRKESL
ncbi:MAG: hypothetical protein KZQ64_09930 [gamma proteobacterium symbiont of Bathyaustriella thionipta]|nr:hypothetical protein [gamma proteobacterium symbiont of Bathyaustriella thionipta]MCU7949221.1 hypothetical protein [gamma proteobacterium symbiont of Bathyaustriella thionipta]MCU7953690.1 hypothetical protein [gamma proteobacterium symbiont of Bathyaustriella thionipta]MCU7955809.1 hypothetical protein [gamma proteobacterium symbiont of Bathyaustriella thionipta]MCU7967903.1 hypothetical protein [gamma proteobacterium symbiont of Bathyaustriella thionipta]